MVQTIQAKDLTLHDIKAKFGLRQTQDEQFFREWRDERPELTELEQRSLEQVKANYLYLAEYPIPESIVKMVVLSPLLSLAGFYSPPFRITAETSVRMTAEDEGEIIQGKIDLLVLQNQFWIIVIEAKQSQFSLEPGIPQALAYMMANPHPEKPAFGLVTNGSNFIFIKLTNQAPPQYALSDEFTLRRSNDLYTVLSILKRLSSVLIQSA